MKKLRFREIQDKIDEQKWKYLDSIAENDHDFWIDEDGKLVLISCQGDYFHVSNVPRTLSRQTLEKISNEFEKQFNFPLLQLRNALRSIN